MPGPDTWSERRWLAVVVALPTALACVHFGLGHGGDIEFFHRWQRAVAESAAFYRDGPGINYPIVGVLLVAGPGCLIERLTGHPLSLEAYWAVLKCTLVVGEMALLLSTEAVARALGHAAPRRLALCLYALPSTWAGSAWFGQIDVWGTALLSIAALGALRYAEAPRSRWLAVALGGLVLSILCKQLTWFALPALAAYLGAAIVRHRAWWHGLAALASPLTLFVADPFLTLPDGARSHLWFVLTHGSGHGELVVASGASLWSLVATGGTPSSEVVWLGTSSQTWGYLAFGLACVGIVALTRRRPDGRGAVLAAGLTQLSMALLLTGVHERYLCHAIPLLVLARALGPPQPAGVLGVSTGVVSGLFVLSTISPWLPESLGHPSPTALLSLAWGVALVHERLRSAPAC